MRRRRTPQATEAGICVGADGLRIPVPGPNDATSDDALAIYHKRRGQPQHTVQCHHAMTSIMRHVESEALIPDKVAHQLDGAWVTVDAHGDDADPAPVHAL